MYYQEYIIRKEGRVSYSIYARANALRIIKFLHSLEDATITTLTNHTDTCTHNMHITFIAIHSTVQYMQRQSTIIYHQAIMDSEAVFVDPIVIARAMMQISTPALRLSLAKEVYPAGGQSRSRFWVTNRTSVPSQSPS